MTVPSPDCSPSPAALNWTAPLIPPGGLGQDVQLLGALGKVTDEDGDIFAQKR